jgi:hypothetical protein
MIAQPLGDYSYTISYLYFFSVVSLVYAFYPIKYQGIERRGFSHILTEQAYIKTILYFEIPILVIILTMVVDSTFYLLPEDFFFNFTEPIYTLVAGPFEGYPIWSTEEPGSALVFNALYFGNIVFQGVAINLGFSVTAGIIWLILIELRKELGYYFAKSLFQTTTEEIEDSRKAEYFIKATKLYDKYLRRILNLEINDAKRVYSKILTDSNKNKNKSMQKIYESFGSSDKLAPINCLSELAPVKDDKVTFLVEESISKKMKDMAIFFATIIPVVVGAIQLWLNTTAKPQP